MTVEERQILFAYCHAIDAAANINSIVESVYGRLSKAGRTAIYEARENLRLVEKELEKICDSTTEWGASREKQNASRP